MIYEKQNTHKTSPFAVAEIRNDFPVLNQKIYGKSLIYFDNGATTQKPRVVIEAINRLHSEQNSNVHRGVHYLSDQMTRLYEEARDKVRKFINANYAHEVVFTKGTTDSINAAAFSFGELCLKEGDEIIVSEMEHHSNIVPWQILCQRKKGICG
jgi:cysteine desulfurase/selenocysteine lyase